MGAATQISVHNGLVTCTLNVGAIANACRHRTTHDVQRKRSYSIAVKLGLSTNMRLSPRRCKISNRVQFAAAATDAIRTWRIGRDRHHHATRTLQNHENICLATFRLAGRLLLELSIPISITPTTESHAMTWQIAGENPSDNPNGWGENPTQISITGAF
jgi:hypothetical protein